jgi:hypothetical protein
VIDNSLSSSVIVEGRPLLHMLRDAALEITSRAAPTDNLWLVTADGVATSGSIAVVRAAIERLEPITGSGDMSLAISRAGALVESAGTSERRIALLTDGQRFEWRDVIRAPTGTAALHAYLPVVALPANRAVVSVEARPPRWTPVGEVAARIASRDSVSYRINLRERTLARGTAAPDDETVVNAAPPERGWVAGFIEIQPDEFRADDIRHFAVWIGAAPRVSVLSSAGVFTRSAVGALISAGRLAEGNDILVGSAEDITRMPALIFPPVDPVRVGAANRALERLGIPLRYGAVVRGDAAARPSVGAAWSDEGVTVRMRYPIATVGTADLDTLATVNGEPWLVAGQGFVLLGSPADADAGNMALRASFVPLMAELLAQRLSGEGGSAISAFPGSTVPRPIWADAIADGDSGVRILDGSNFTAPGRAGVYALSRAGRQSGALVVNPPSGEFDLDRISHAELRARFEGERLAVGSDRERWVREVFESGGRRPLLLPFLVVALCALALESIASRDGDLRRKR